jgi:hypothetical protein
MANQAKLEKLEGIKDLISRQLQVETANHQEGASFQHVNEKILADLFQKRIWAILIQTSLPMKPIQWVIGLA